MDARERSRRRAQIEAHFRAVGLPLTVQRRTILDIVLAHDGHPTIDQVLAVARRRAPSVSRATVHRTLETFVRFGLLAKTQIPSRATRYDTRLDRHHHFVCTACETVMDMSDPALETLPVPDASRLGFEVRDFVVQLRGLCRGCRTGRSGGGRLRSRPGPPGERR